MENSELFPNEPGEVSNFEVRSTESYGSGELLGSATVTAVDSNTKSVTLEVNDLPPLKPGDEGYVDPVELEKKLVAEEQARLNKPSDPEEVACMMLKLYTPRFNALVEALPKRACARLIKALVAYPLGKDYTHTSKKEAEAFSIGSALMDAKMVLVVKTYHDNREEIEELAREAAANATFEYGDKAEAIMNEEQKEVTNG